MRRLWCSPSFAGEVASSNTTLPSAFTSRIRPVEFSPTIVRIPLKQHVGAPSKPVVEVGGNVRQGDLIAGAPAEGLGANVHASVSGTVMDITDKISIAPTEGGRR